MKLWLKVLLPIALLLPRAAAGRQDGFPARVRAAREISLSAEVGGRVVERRARRNGLVKKGDVILVLDPTFHQLAVRAAEADLMKTEAAEVWAKAELGRARRMSASESMAPSASEEAVAAEARARAGVMAAQVALEEARERLKRTRIAAPEDGALSELFPEVGELVQAGSSVAELLTVQDLVAESFVGPRDVLSLREGAAVSVRVAPPLDMVVPGRVREVAVAAGAQQTFRLVVEIPDPPAALRAGFEATLIVTPPR